MSWEVRGRCRYYTRSRKVNGRIIREYVGKGPEAELAAALDAERRRQRQALREERNAERRRWEAVSGALRPLTQVSQLLFRAALLAAGFHQHERGAWRKRHNDHRT
jgi:hypothetical protein